MAFMACNASCGCVYRVSEKKFIEVQTCDDHKAEQAHHGAVDYITENTDMMCDIETSEEAVDYE